jgi:hypothetical protein
MIIIRNKRQKLPLSSVLCSMKVVKEKERKNTPVRERRKKRKEKEKRRLFYIKFLQGKKWVCYTIKLKTVPCLQNKEGCSSSTEDKTGERTANLATRTSVRGKRASRLGRTPTVRASEARRSKARGTCSRNNRHRRSRCGGGRDGRRVAQTNSRLAVNSIGDKLDLGNDEGTLDSRGESR